MEAGRRCPVAGMGGSFGAGSSKFERTGPVKSKEGIVVETASLEEIMLCP